MSLLFGQFKMGVLRVLDDLARSNPSWTDDDLLDYANDALTEMSEHTAQMVQIDTVLTADLPSYTYPDNYLEPGSVWLITGIYRYVLAPIKLQAGQDLPLIITPGKRTQYYEFPFGTINFLRALPIGDTIRVQYFAYWDKIEDDNSPINVPRWMQEALKWNMLARAMAKPGAQRANLAQYATKRDLGPMDDNPLLEYAKWAQRQYDRVMAEHAPQARQTWEID